MKTVKTRSNKRGTYTYTFDDGKKTDLAPGKVDLATGYVLTEEGIKRLHRLDDNEVYNNVKNSKPPIQDWEKPFIEEWKKAHPYDDLPSRSNVSLDAEGEDDEGIDDDADSINMKGEETMNNSVNTTISGTQPNTESKLSMKPIEGSNKNEKYMWLNNADLQICPDIQRELDSIRVAEIQEKFDPLVANPIKVSYRDGQYFIFEGMHTRAAICGLNKTDNFPIFCRVYFGLTKEDEARLFATQFGISKAVPMGYKLRALNVAKDQDVLDFLDTTVASGFGVMLGGRTGRNGTIAATVTAFKAYGDLGGYEYGRMLQLLRRTWTGEPWSLSKHMLGGMVRFMKMYKFDSDSFIKVFREVTYDEITTEAKRFTGMSKDGAFAAALAEIYDRRNPEPLKDIA